MANFKNKQLEKVELLSRNGVSEIGVKEAILFISEDKIFGYN